MTDEELEGLIKETSEQLESLPDDPEKPLTKEEKNRKIVLRLQLETLNRLKEGQKKLIPEAMYTASGQCFTKCLQVHRLLVAII